MDHLGGAVGASRAEDYGVVVGAAAAVAAAATVVGSVAVLFEVVHIFCKPGLAREDRGVS